MNIDRLRELEKEGLITLRKHPVYDVWVANYTQSTQFNRQWTRETISCRGLVVDENRVLGRGPVKFFNVSELQGLRNHLWNLYGVKYSEIWTKPFIAYEKLDGSMLLRFRLPNGKWEVATRGSFESEQSEKGREIWKNKYKEVELDWRYSYVFELLYKSNRIVVDYGNIEDIILLMVINNETGNELTYNEITDLNLPFQRPKVYRDVVALEQAEKEVENYENFEGFVLDFGGGFRCKQKASRYVAIHRIVSDLTPRKVFEALSNDVVLDDWLKDVPDEFYNEIQGMAEEIYSKYNAVEAQAMKDFWAAPATPIRKDFADYATKCKYPSLLFKLYDTGNIRPMVWDIVGKEY